MPLASRRCGLRAQEDPLAFQLCWQGISVSSQGPGGASQSDVALSTSQMDQVLELSVLWQ